MAPAFESKGSTTLYRSRYLIFTLLDSFLVGVHAFVDNLYRVTKLAASRSLVEFASSPTQLLGSAEHA